MGFDENSAQIHVKRGVTFINWHDAIDSHCNKCIQRSKYIGSPSDQLIDSIIPTT
jgi:hypothetical protein